MLYKKLLETVLFASIRFHDTISRGRLLNRFGKDFEEIDSSLADDIGGSVFNCLGVVITLVTICVVGGLPFLLAASLIGVLCYNSEFSDTSLTSVSQYPCSCSSVRPDES